MKYILISSSKKEITPCYKVNIQGFDYYVSDEYIKTLNPNDRYYTIVENPRRIVQYYKHIQSRDSVIIATNNPNVDIPKVRDIAISLSEDYDNFGQDSSMFDEQERYLNKSGFINGYNKSQETHPFSEEDMIEFTEWCRDKAVREFAYGIGDTNNWELRGEQRIKTTKELLEIWKNQRTTRLYYA